MRFWLEHPDDYRIVFLRRALKPCAEAAHVLAPGETLLARLTGRIAEAAEAGALRCLGSPQATALSVWAAMSGMIGLRLRYPDFPWPPVDEHIEAMAELILHGCEKGGAEASPEHAFLPPQRRRYEPSPRPRGEGSNQMRRCNGFVSTRN